MEWSKNCHRDCAIITTNQIQRPERKPHLQNSRTLEQKIYKQEIQPNTTEGRAHKITMGILFLRYRCEEKVSLNES